MIDRINSQVLAVALLAAMEDKDMEEKCVEMSSEEITEAMSSEDNTDPISDDTYLGAEASGGVTERFIDKNPEDLLKFIEKYVKLQLERKLSYVGFVHSIDPITHSVIISIPRDGSYQTTLIPGTSIIDIVEMPHNSSIALPERNEIQEESLDIRQIQKRKIISWLKDNMLPVTGDEDNVVFSGISLLPPYGVRDICTANPLVALEVQKLINRMPADYQPK